MGFEKPYYTCSEMVEHVTDFLEGALSRGEWVRFQLHLGSCPDCRVYLEQIRATVEVCRRLPTEPTREDLQQQLRERFRAWKRKRNDTSEENA